MLTAAPLGHDDRPAPNHYRQRLSALLRECDTVVVLRAEPRHQPPRPPAAPIRAAQMALPLGRSRARVRGRR